MTGKESGMPMTGANRVKNETADYDRSTNESTIGRRRFSNVLLGGSSLALIMSMLYPVLRFLFPPRSVRVAEESVRLGPVDDFAMNSGHVFSFEGEPAILIRTPQGVFRAFTGTCTHLACTVGYRPDLSHIWCACHNGHFDLMGNNIQGPPPRPLTPFDVQLIDGDVVVRRIT